MNALIIGGTRNLGPTLVTTLLEAGYNVTVLNRGLTAGPAIPAGVSRITADRSDPTQFAAAMAGREYDLVVDTTLYTGPEAESVVRALNGRVGRYLFLSTGQVYLVRLELERPYLESDYDGVVMDDPGPDHQEDHDDWVYGVDKRAGEDVFTRAWNEHGFPFTSLRLPMVNSERDHHDRIYNYWLRLRDGGPIVVPDGRGLPLRHVYGGDVTQAVVRLAAGDIGVGRAYNISQDETLTIDAFLELLAAAAGKPLRIVRLPRERLAGFLPACSPFSGHWMSVLDNQRSKDELGMRYTPVSDYLATLIAFHASQPVRDVPGYRQRARELEVR